MAKKHLFSVVYKKTTSYLKDHQYDLENLSPNFYTELGVPPLVRCSTCYKVFPFESPSLNYDSQGTIVCESCKDKIVELKITDAMKTVKYPSSIDVKEPVIHLPTNKESKKKPKGLYCEDCIANSCFNCPYKHYGS